MIGFGDVEYADPASGPAEDINPGRDGSLTRGPEPVPTHVDAEIRVHVRAALARVGWPPEPADDYHLETP